MKCRPRRVRTAGWPIAASRSTSGLGETRSIRELEGLVEVFPPAKAKHTEHGSESALHSNRYSACPRSSLLMGFFLGLTARVSEGCGSAQ